MKENPDIDLLKKEAKQLKTLIDLILMCYLEAEHRVDPEQEIVNVEDFLEDLRANWSNFLKRYLRDLDNIDDSQKH
jgi:flagellin-specific chaperone FliS